MRLRFAALALCLLTASAVRSAPVDPAVRARDFLAAMKAGKWDEAAVPFDAAMKAALPPAALQRTWEQLKGQVGSLKSEGPLRAVKSDGITAILQKLTFDAAELDMRVAVHDNTGEIAGLFFTPASGEGTPVGAESSTTSAVPALPADVKVEPAPAASTDATAVATTLLDDLQRDRFDDAFARFDATIASMIPAAKLADIWHDLVATHGTLGELPAPTSRVEAGNTVVVQRLPFSGGALEMTTTVNAAGHVAGLLFSPVKAASMAPPPGAPFEEKPITVGDGGGSLPGLLTVPRKDGPWPIVVFVHGSGPNDRDETIGPNTPFRDLAWGLAEKGIASIRYDKRTFAHPEALAAMTQDLTLDQETILDAVAALRLARTVPGADPKRVVLLGHSLGAMAAPRIAQRAPGLAGIVFVAAPAGSLEDAILRQTEYVAKSDGAIDAGEQQGIDQVRRQVAAVKDPSLSRQTPSLSLPLGVPASYWMDLHAHDTVKEAAAIPLPMLFVQGGRDYQVTTADLDAYRKAMQDRKDVRFVVLPSLNHLLIAGKAPSKPAEYAVAGKVAPEAVEAIASFVQSLP